MKVNIAIATGVPRGTMAFQRPEDSTMSVGELAAMEEEARNLPVSMGGLLEVGCYHGRTTVILAQVSPVDVVEWFGGNVELAPPENRAHTGWDPDHQKRHLFANLDSIPGVRARVNILAGSSHDILPKLTGVHYRLAVLDADKREQSVYEDIRDVWPLIPSGGTLFMDDWSAPTFDEPPYTVRRAWERFEKETGLDLQVDILGFEPPDFATAVKLARIRKP